MRYVERVRGLYAGNWQLQPTLNNQYLYSLSCNGKIIAQIGGAAVNSFPENKALVNKWRAHRAEDGRSGSMEYSTVFPLEREIQVDRRVNIFNGAAMVTTDIGGGIVRNLELDEIFLPGKWLRADIYNGDGFDSIQLSSTIKAPLPVLAVTFTAEDGRKFEFGCGDDLWRYSATEQFGSCTPELTIIPEDNGVKIIRKIIDVPDTVENFPLRPWRFSWYFAWNTPTVPQHIPNAAVYDINTLDIPANSRILAEDLSRKSTPCLIAAPARKAVRKLIRSTGTDLVLEQAQANLCFDAAHIERPQKKILLHWDLTELFDLHVWGTKQLDNKNLKFAIRFNPESPQNRLLAAQAIQSELLNDMEIGDYE